MSTIRARLAEIRMRHADWRQRRQDCKLLLKLSDRALKDINVSREELMRGTKGWPWLLPADDWSQPFRFAGIAKVADELAAYSDVDLADIGVARGEIPEAVVFGRPGIEWPAQTSEIMRPKAA